MAQANFNFADIITKCLQNEIARNLQRVHMVGKHHPQVQKDFLGRP